VNGNTLASVLLVKGKVKDKVWGLGSAGKDVSVYVGQMAQAGGEDRDGQIDPELVRDFWYLDQATLLAQVGAHKRAGAPAKVEALPEAREVIADPTVQMAEAFAVFNKGYMAAGQAGDVAAMTEAYADNAVVRYVPQAKPIEGKKAVSAWLKKAGDGFKLSMRRQWGAGDWIVAETLADGKVGDKAYQVKRLELLRYADGAIAEHWIFVNELDRMVDLGEFDPAKLTVAPQADAPAGDEPASGAATGGKAPAAPPQ
jgi:ketosteroid isomerase-like protein